MQCEVCGVPIVGKPHRAVIDGARIFICSGCAKSIRTESWVDRPPTTKSSKPPRIAVRARGPPRRGRQAERTLGEEVEVVEDFGKEIRRARERAGLSHKQLGQKIGEKVSVLQKLETGKLTPSSTLSRKLEHTLKIKLLIQSEGAKASLKPQPAEALTLGDILSAKKKSSEE